MLHKLFLYGGPGVGKSVFALQFPKPFFITTDGNYEFLELFGAKKEAHKQCFNWQEIKKIIQDLYSTNKYDNYQTIVLDLIEDAWKWCETEWLEKNKIEHPSDMGWGKAYDVPRNKFFIEIGKLLGVPKNVILLSHEFANVKKTKKGIEYTIYSPSNKLPDKLMDSIEGRLTACLRCYTDILVDEEGHQVKSRFLNLVPQDDEYGIIRGINENTTPHTIELKYSIFNKVLGEQQIEAAQEFLNMLEKDEDVKEFKKVKKEETEKTEESVEEKPKRKIRKSKDVDDEEVKEKLPEPEENEETPVQEGSDKIEISEPKKELSNEDKKASILAKLRARQEKVESEEKTEQVVEEKQTVSKADLLKKLRKAKEKKSEEISEEKEKVEEIQEEKKVESREEKLARLRRMRG